MWCIPQATWATGWFPGRASGAGGSRVSLDASRSWSLLTASSKVFKEEQPDQYR